VHLVHNRTRDSSPSSQLPYHDPEIVIRAVADLTGVEHGKYKKLEAQPEKESSTSGLRLKADDGRKGVTADFVGYVREAVDCVKRAPDMIL
jgi:hypothetical protein